jgi:type III secretory pathway component EscS
MRRKLTIILLVEALALFLLSVYRPYRENFFTTLMAFPLEQLGWGLRKISLSGTIGNFISIIIYCAICLSPGVYLAFRLYRRRAHVEDGLLAVLSLILFWVIYMMINPADIAQHFGSFDLIDINKAFLGIVVYSIAAGYLILRMIRALKDIKTSSILKYLKILLSIICIALVYGIVGSGLMDLSSAFQQLSAGNTGAEQNLGLSYAFLVLQYLVSVLPLALEIIILYAGLELIDAFKRDPYGQDVVTSSQKITRICRWTVAAIMLSQISVNILQLILGSSVHSTHYTLSIPLLSIVFVLITMLLAGYFEQARQLKKDSEMFI